MRIWCCLCFIVDEEEDNRRIETMKEGILANVDGFEGNIVNDEDDDDREEREKGGEEGEGASSGVAVAAAAVQFSLTLNRRRQGEETSLLFEEMESAMRCGGNWDDATWRPLNRCSFLSEGDPSASASTAVEGFDNHGSYHKRAKVYSGFHESTSCPLTGRYYNINEGSSNSSSNVIFDHNFILNDGINDHPVSGNDEVDDKHEGGSRAEDF